MSSECLWGSSAFKSEHITRRSSWSFCSSDPQSSFLAARYLSRFIMRIRTRAARSSSTTFKVASWLSRHYLDEAVKTPSAIEWPNLDKLFSAENFGPSGILVSGTSTLAKLTPHLLRWVSILDEIVSAWNTHADSERSKPYTVPYTRSSPQQDLKCTERTTLTRTPIRISSIS